MVAEPDDLVIVANRLPIEAVDTEDGVQWRRSPGGLVTAIEPSLQGRNARWIGWTGTYPESADVPLPQVPETAPDSEYKVSEVRLLKDEVELYYDGFSNAALWPLYHDAVATPAYHRHHFDAYRRVNMKFAQAAAETTAPGGTVWVQDYQLQLVPAMLRSLRPDLAIGFFLHIPFPPSELFLQLPWRRPLMLGLLGADLIGFQTVGAARNFAAVAERLLGLPAIDDTISVPAPHGGRRKVTLGAFPVSVDFAHIESIAKDPHTADRAAHLRHQLGSPQTVLLGVDRLDYTKGIDVRLRAYTELLHERRLEPDTTVLVQVATPSREHVDEYKRIRESVELIVGRTNGELGRIGAPAIHYLHQPLALDELIALYLAADIMLVTPLRDGMNLVSKEYVAARVDNGGALVLSEFTGAAHELVQAWLVNPYDADGVKEAIVAAATSSPEERERRMRAMRAEVAEYDVQYWAGSFLRTLDEAAARSRAAANGVAPGGGI